MTPPNVAGRPRARSIAVPSMNTQHAIAARSPRRSGSMGCGVDAIVLGVQRPRRQQLREANECS